MFFSGYVSTHGEAFSAAEIFSLATDGFVWLRMTFSSRDYFFQP